MNLCFRTNINDVSVAFDGSICAIQTLTDTSLECKTSSHKGTIVADPDITVANKGKALPVRHLLYDTIFHRPITHTCITAHPQTLENHNFFPSLFNVHVEAHLQTLKNPMGTWTAKYGIIII